MKLRNSAKCVVIENGRVLLTRCVEPGREWYCCPGGGQEPNESLQQAAAREFHEETGAFAAVGEMMAISEYLDKDNATHAVVFYFRAKLLPGPAPGMGKTPDTAQVAVEWVEFDRLDAVNFQPAFLIPLLREPGKFRYFGLEP